MNNFIKRDDYIRQLLGHKDKPIIKVITGVRRCGKSTLLEIYKRLLLKNGITKKQIIFINFDDILNEELLDYKKLYNFVQSKIIKNKKNYIFFDEIQLVKKFEKTINSLLIKPNIDIYITGSNAYFMSKELATFLSGRYVEINMLPLSFKEYCNARNRSDCIENLYQDYITYSSYPFTLLYNKNKEMIDSYLNGLYNTTMRKDILQKFSIVDNGSLDLVTKFLYSNIGSITSTKKIVNYFNSCGKKIDWKTINKYLNALCLSLLFYRANRYNVRGGLIFRTNEKFYSSDIAIRNIIIRSEYKDEGHIFENIIYLELIRRGYQVYIGQLDNREIDFVAVKGIEILYIQVSASIKDKSTFKREIEPLIKIKNHHPKILLTLDKTTESNFNGIKIKSGLDWLLDI